MKDYLILVYGGLSGCISEILGNFSNFWSYSGHYHSANPFLVSEGVLKNLNLKKQFIHSTILQEYELKRLIKKFAYDSKWNSIAWSLRFYVKVGLNKFLTRNSIESKHSLRQFFNSFLSGFISQLCCQAVFSLRNYYKYSAYRDFKSSCSLMVGFGTLFGQKTFDLLNIMVQKKHSQKFLIIQKYLIAQFSSIIACLVDSLYYYFIIKRSSRFQFIYTERLFISKKGMALFIFEYFSTKEQKD